MKPHFHASPETEAPDEVRPVAHRPGEVVAAVEKPLRFPAFAHRNFRLFWSGNVISLLGTLAQEAAR